MNLADKNKPGVNCFLPDEVLKALKPIKAVPKADKPEKTKHQPTCPASSRPPDNLWFYPRQRQKFQHLLNETICNCGAGKDISFLYDAASLKPVSKPDPFAAELAIKDKSDPSYVRKELLPKKLPTVVTAEEMQLVQNIGTESLAIYQQDREITVADHFKHPALLPAMGPTSREQAKNLRKTLDNLLSKIGFGEEGADKPTQMHHLLEIVKQEQDIYNTVFHELIRQVTVDCFERGELLSQIRDKYNLLINRIPKQILSLHHELVAQRALDRRLVEELARFQSTITTLTRDLERARAHDKLVSDQADQMEKELKQALRQSERTDDLVSQFRQLYELQRSRLEARVTLLVEERDNWVNMSYMMAAKVIDANGLNAARNALQTERSWNTMALHFAAVLSDKDANCLIRIAEYVQKVGTECNFLSATAANEAEVIKAKLTTLRASMMRMVNRPVVKRRILHDDKGSPRKSIEKDPAQAPVDADVFMDRVRRWNQVVSELSELMSGDALLIKRQRVDGCKANFAECRETALTLYQFHKAADGSDLPSRALLSKITKDLPMWLESMFVQMAGDGGLGAALARYAREMDLWLNTSQSEGLDIAKVQGTLQTWIRRTIECINFFDEAMKVEKLDLKTISLDIEKWVSDLNNEIGGDNGVITDRSRELHQTWLQWLAQALTRLVPEHQGASDDQVQRSSKFLLPVENVMRAAINLGRAADGFTELIILCLRDRVRDNEEDTKALVQLKEDCHIWLEATWELLAQFMPEEEFITSVKWSGAILSLPRLRAAINTRCWEEVPESDVLYYADGDRERTELDDDDLKSEDTDDEAALLAPGPPKMPAESDKKKVNESTPTDGEGEDILRDEQHRKQPAGGEDVQWVNEEGAVHSYQPDQPPESRQHLSTLTTGLAAFLPDTQKSASAISIVETLQDQLQSTEERCRELEIRARKAEHSLGELEDKMRLLEKGPPLPEGQEWRMSEDPEFAAIFEKVSIL